MNFEEYSKPDAGGHFGPYGGKFVPETLVPVLEELESVYFEAKNNKAFRDELNILLKEFVGRPTPLYVAERLTEHIGGAKIYLKREDHCHTGAHKINNSIGKSLVAREMGKKRNIAETGAGENGGARATEAERGDREGA